MGVDMPLVIFAAFIVLYFLSCIKILKEYERGVIFRLGRLLPKPKGPGIIFVLKPIDKIVRVGLRLVVLDVPPQDIITKDNVSVQVNAVVYFRVMDANRAIVEVENFQFATSQLAQTTLRSVIGQRELDELLSSREQINAQVQEILDKATDPWGIKVTNVEVKHVDLTEELKRAMARQAEAERERRAKVINAEGEFQAAKNLVEAAKMMGDHPMALQMRYLQTMSEISSENNTTTFLPIPLDLLKPFLGGK
jgi:regulator of protease activity HflC (stomatin/prohibitin superfamily)